MVIIYFSSKKAQNILGISQFEELEKKYSLFGESIRLYQFLPLNLQQETKYTIFSPKIRPEILFSLRFTFIRKLEIFLIKIATHRYENKLFESNSWLREKKKLQWKVMTNKNIKLRKNEHIV